VYDCEPAFSPDGRSVAFVRENFSGTLGALFVQAISGASPKQLTPGNSRDPVWTPDGRQIVFSSQLGGVLTLSRISASGGTPQPVAGVGEMGFSPSISHKGNQLVYQHTARSDSVFALI
jgi:TolB protein